MPQPEKKKVEMPWLLLAGSVLAFALCVPVIAAVLRQIDPGRKKSPEAAALAQGPDIPAEGTFVTAHCAEPCRLGTYVKLIVGRTEKKSWLVAYAEDRAKHRVWYFPSASGVMPEVAPQKDVTVLSEAIKLSDEHKSEREWTLHLLLVDQPLGRDAAAAASPDHVLARDALQLVLGEGKR